MSFGYSTLDHWGIAKLVGAHAKPPNYMFFFEYYESGNLAGKLHVDEWSPSIREALEIAAHLGVLCMCIFQLLVFFHVNMDNTNFFFFSVCELFNLSNMVNDVM